MIILGVCVHKTEQNTTNYFVVFGQADGLGGTGSNVKLKCGWGEKSGAQML